MKKILFPYAPISLLAPLLISLLVHLCISFAYAEENTFHIDVHYPQKVRIGQSTPIEITLPPFMPEGSTPTVKIETSTSPQEDFTLVEGMPTSTLIFHKAGMYAFSVHIGFSLKDL